MIIPAWTEEYKTRVFQKALELKSDGCTGVPDWFVYACWEHDIHYRTHQTLYNEPLTRREADYLLRLRVQEDSSLGVFSPISWIRWLGVRLISWNYW